MANSVNINKTDNDVSIVNTNQQIIVSDDSKQTLINVTQPVTAIVQVNTPGPRGEKGDPGEGIDINSLVTTASFNAFTSSYNTGSFTGSFSGSFFGTSSWSLRALTSSFVTASNVFGPFGSSSVNRALTASMALTALSASYLPFNYYNINVAGADVANFANTANSAAQSDQAIQVSIKSVKPTGIYPFLIPKDLYQGVDYYSSLAVSNFNYDPQQNRIFYNKADTGELAQLEIGNKGYLGSGKIVVYGEMWAESLNILPGSIKFVDAVNTASFNNLTSLSYINNRLVLSTGSYSGSFSGSFFGTSSWAISSSRALTASFYGGNIINSQLPSQINVVGISASFTGSLTGALIGTSSWTTNALTASFAPSYVLNSATSSFVLNSQTSSFSTGSFTGSFTGSLFGTSSWAFSSSQAVTASYVTGSIFGSTNPATSASYALTASFALNAGGGAGFPFSGNAVITGSLLVSGSGVVITGSLNAPNITGSLFGTASWANISLTSSFITGSIFTSTNPALSSSYALTASYALNAGSGLSGTGTGSNATASFTNQTTWTFNHNLNSQYVIVQAYDTGWNQVIPQNIQLVDDNQSVITFPSQQSGYAIASLGGANITTIIGGGGGSNFIATGSVTASVDVTSNLFLIRSASSTVFSISNTGQTTISGSASNLFLIRNATNTPILTVSQSGVIILSTQSIQLTGDAPYGGMYFTSDALYIGID